MSIDCVDESRDTVWRLFLTTHAKLVDLIEQELVQAELPPLPWYDVLSALAAAPHYQLRMHELANAIILDCSNLTRLVDRLEAKGLVCRKTCPTDRRGSFAAITDAGLAMWQRMRPVYEQAVSNYFARYLSDAEVEILTLALKRMQLEVVQRKSIKQPLQRFSA
ncbi:MAG: MarR family transcriptional regulator [Chroococcidiopsidaceae cyanobacterium CP_BM_ER_R8_30]|nr:MarR family transcriptional regulator [Chroococcidiopsidaceae cyanobacterium CP_BM_ER_R8_30]